MKMGSVVARAASRCSAAGSRASPQAPARSFYINRSWRLARERQEAGDALDGHPDALAKPHEEL